jgi:DNA-binding transcriptional ArsR family regulator
MGSLKLDNPVHPETSGETSVNPASMRKLRSSAQEACGLLSVLAHEDRLVLLCQIAHQEHSVGELEELLDIHQPSLSQQLGVLRREGLVATRRDGKKIFYRLKSKEALAIIDSLYTQFCSGRTQTRRPKAAQG